MKINQNKYLIVGASSHITQELLSSLEANERAVLVGRSLGSTKPRDGDLFYPVDLQDSEQIKLFLNQSGFESEAPGKILFLAAPAYELARFNKTDLGIFEMNYKVQIASSIQILQYILPIMSKNKFGRIVFINSSVTGSKTPAMLSHYNIFKFAQIGLVKSLVSEFSEKGININIVSPSMMDTPFLKNTPELIKKMNMEAHPLKRLIKVKEIIPSIKLLLSDDANYINGANIAIDGGQ